MNTSLRIPGYLQGLAVGLALFCGGHRGVLAEPPPAAVTDASTASPTSDAQDSLPRRDFLAALRQGFSEDFDQEVVRGHFDVGSPPDVHRYYCMVNAKTGKSEANAVAGQLVVRADKMTGIKGAAVSPFSCADAARAGTLVTTGYVLSDSLSKKVIAASPAQAPAPAAAAVPATAAAVVPASTAAVPATAAAAVPAGAAAVPAGAAAVPAGGPAQMDVMAVYRRFIAGQNAHDRAGVSETLLHSSDFVWARYDGNSIWGYKEAMEAFEQAWNGTWKMDPQMEEPRIASVSPGVAVLIAPLLVTRGDPGKSASTIPIRWGGVFTQTQSGWRIASIFISPFENWRAPASGG